MNVAPAITKVYVDLKRLFEVSWNTGGVAEKDVDIFIGQLEGRSAYQRLKSLLDVCITLLLVVSRSCVRSPAVFVEADSALLQCRFWCENAGSALQSAQGMSGLCTHAARASGSERPP